jgi:hypothetical protein
MSSYLSPCFLHLVIGLLRKLSCVVTIPKCTSGPHHAKLWSVLYVALSGQHFVTQTRSIAPPFYFIALSAALGSLLSRCSGVAWLVTLGSLSDVLCADPHSAFLKALKVKVHSCPDSPHRVHPAGQSVLLRSGWRMGQFNRGSTAYWLGFQICPYLDKWQRGRQGGRCATLGVKSTKKLRWKLRC